MKYFSKLGLDKRFQTTRLFVVLVIWLSQAAFAQGGANASLYGTVSDSTGATVSGAKVTATNLGTNRSWTTVTNDSGSYLFADLPIGQYKVGAEAGKSQFAPFEVTGLTLAVAQSALQNIVLKPGTVQEAVTVTAATPMVDSESAGTKDTTQRQFVDDLPLIDRDVSALETIQAGTGNATVNGDLTVNGGRPGHNQFELNGTTVNNPQYSQLQFSGLKSAPSLPSPDAVEEFTIVKNGYEAQYGRADSGQVIIATRSGTNQFHGSAFDYLRNNALDARPYFADSKTPYRRNIFGGTFGGPVQKDRIFFFGSYQGTRTTASPNSGVENIVPTQDERNGDFSALATPIIDPTTNQPFQGNVIPSARLSPISQSLLKALVPLPNGPNGELVYAPTGKFSDNQGIGKVDVALTDNDHLSGSYFINRSTNLSNTGLPTLFDGLDLSHQVITVNETHNFSPNLLNDLSIGGLHYSYNEAPAVAGDPTMNTYGATYYIPPGGHSLSLNVSGNLSISDGVPSERPSQFIQVQDSVHWVKGNHSFIFGGSADRARTWTHTRYIQAGTFGFNGYASGNGVADFMLGLPSSFGQNSGAYLPYTGSDYAIYAQDTWRATRDFTVNYGLRYAPAIYQTLDNGENANFIPGEQSTVFPGAPLSLVYKGDPGIHGNSLHAPDWKVFDPRVGIAWSPFGHSNWVVRSSFGVFHEMPLTFTVDNSLAPPFTSSSVLNTPNYANPWQGMTDPFPFTPVLPTSSLAARQNAQFLPDVILGDFISPSAKIPTSFQWNLAIQHQLSRHDGVEIAYVGAHTYRMLLTNDPNAPVYIPGQSTQSNIDSRRPYGPAIGEVLENEPIGSSNYNSLQITYRHDFAYGLTVLADYTWEKTLTISGNDFDQSTTIHDPFNLRSWYGPADFDVPHTLNVAYAWKVPWLASSRGVGAYLAKGWVVSGVARAASGTPITILSGVDNSLSGYGDDYADQVGNPKLSSSRSRTQEVQEWFNTQAFVVNALGTYGDSRRGAVRGPGSFTWDMSFVRQFPITERLRLEYRFDGSNIFNHTVLSNPNNNVSSAGFGTIQGAGNPRILQMALRVAF